MRRSRSPAKIVAFASAMMFVGSAAQAQVWWDPTFHALGTSVTVRYLGSSASFFNTMQWFKVPFAAIDFLALPGGPNPDIVDYDALGGVTGGNYENLFTNKNRAVNTVSYGGATDVVLAGAKNSIGDEVTFTTTHGQEVLLGLFVNNENSGPGGWNADWAAQDKNDYTYFTGPARNVDGTFHLKVVQIGNAYQVYGGGWEDIRDGGDLDYNDVLFEIEGVHVNPEPVTLTLLGTGLAGVAAARRRRNKSASSDV